MPIIISIMLVAVPGLRAVPGAVLRAVPGTVLRAVLGTRGQLGE